MNKATERKPFPVHLLEADEAGRTSNFRVYNYAGQIPNLSDFLVPHRKDHYLIVFMRQPGRRQWIDTTPYDLKKKTIYFTGPNQVIVKEEFDALWSTGLAFKRGFLAFQENASLESLPLIQNPKNGHELLLNKGDVDFVEDMLGKINKEYSHPGEWREPMIAAYLTVFLTYLSRLYVDQYKNNEVTTDRGLLRQFQDLISECFRELREVSDYASRLHISPGHLSEVVKAQSGKPAIKHIHDRLLLEARRLLFHTNDSIKEIAFELGFSEASYFNRFFKREAGVTASEYRNNVREMYR